MNISEENNRLAHLAYRRINEAIEKCGTIDLAQLNREELVEQERLRRIGIYILK